MLLSCPRAPFLACHSLTTQLCCPRRPSATQADVFRGTAAHAVEDVLRGINSCVLCYGQTGAGKTYTTFGPDIDW